MSKDARLQRTTTLSGAMLLGLGSILGTGAFVSIGYGVNLAGTWVVGAIFIAAVVALLNGLSSAQLAAVHPISGGTYEYGYRFLNHDLGFIAGWFFVLAKSASAATAVLAVGWLLSLYLPDYEGLQTPIAAVILTLLTLCVAGGLRRSNWLNAVLVSAAVIALILFIMNAPSAADLAANAMPAFTEGSITGLLTGAALLFVAYTGYGRIATMGEEVAEPRRTIPRAIVLTLAVITLLYVGIGWAMLRYPATVAGDDFVLAQVMQPGWLRDLVSWGAILAMVGVALNLLLGVSRVVLAMARRGDLPVAWSQLNNTRTSAPKALWVTFVVMLVLVLLGSVKLAWTFSAFTVLIYYGLTNLAALKVPNAERFVPRWVSVLGLLSCLTLAVVVDLQVVLAGLALLVIGLIWHRYRYASHIAKQH